MPAFYSHQLLAEEILYKLPKNLFNKVSNLGAYYLGAQGADPLFIYRSLSKKHFNLGKLLHSQNIYEFFSVCKNVVNSEPDNDCLSFMFGYLTHYAVDTIFHPYVYCVEKSIKSTLSKSRRKDKVHFLIERDIDVFLFEEYKKSNLKSYTFPFTFGDNSYKPAFNLLDEAVWETFSIRLNYKNIKSAYSRFFRSQKLLLDKHNFFRPVIYGIEKVFFAPHVLSYMFVRSTPDLHFSNFKKDNLSCGNFDVFELATKSISQAVTLIKEFDNCDNAKHLDKNLFSTNFNFGK